MATDTMQPGVDPIDAIQDSPDPYSDKEAIRALVNRKRDEWGRGRESFVRATYRNLLFYRGVQWILWDRGMSRFRPAILPKGTPTPVTNVFASTADASISVFARIEPRLNFAPGNPEEPEDRATADVASRAIDVVEEETAIRMQRQRLAVWAYFSGMAWLENGYDPDPIHGMVSMKVDICQSCQNQQASGGEACESCGDPNLLQGSSEHPRGKQYAEVCNIFEMFFDMGVEEWTQQTEYIREKTVLVDRAKARWADIADSIVGHIVTGQDQWYIDSLASLGPSLDEKSRGRLVSGNTRQASSVTEQWYWSLPTKDYPEGLCAVIVGKTTVAYAGPLPYGSLEPDGTRKGFLPHVCFPQKLVAGSAYAKTVADDVAVLQAKRNRWESIIESCGMRVGAPVWMKPQGSAVGAFSGEPGAVITYNVVNGQKPERIQGQGIPLSFIQRIEKIDREIEEIAGTFEVIKGSRPQGVSAGIALQILQERGMSRFGPLFILWETAWAQQAKQMIEIFRQFATEERLLRIKGRDGAWEVKKFIGADLSGRVDVIPEAGSSMPRSSLVDRAEIEQLMAQGVLQIQDPSVRFEVLKIYGKTHMLPGLERDTKNAIMEDEAFAELATNEVFTAPVSAVVLANLRQLDYPTIMAELEAQGIKIPRVWPGLDDHSVHSREHGQFGKSESFRQYPEVIQILLEKHKEFHDQLLLQQQQMLAGMQRGQAATQPGFNAAPPHVTMESPMNAGGSMASMQGDMSEMGQDVAAGSPSA